MTTHTHTHTHTHIRTHYKSCSHLFIVISFHFVISVRNIDYTVISEMNCYYVERLHIQNEPVATPKKLKK